MASRNILVRAGPDAVWSVLADGYSYAEWVVGTRSIHHVDAGWPEPGSSLRYTAGLGPLTIEDTTTARICEPVEWLEMEANADPYGSVRVSIHVLPWGDASVVVVDEHPLRGPDLLANPLTELALTVRNRLMLRRLARLVEARYPPVSA